MVTSTSAIGATSSASAGSSAATTSLSSSSQDFDRFLKLLTAQMKYQDPMQPTDPTQFVAQLAQFSQVEQQTKSNTLLQSILTEVSGTGSLVQTAGLIGKSVQTGISHVTLPATGSAAPVSVSIPTTSILTNLRIEVLDSNSHVLRSLPVSKGDSSFTFDGRDANGSRLPAGNYPLRVVGENAGNIRQDAGTISSAGKITEVRRDHGGNFVLALENGNTVSQDDIARLTQ
ncbi:flagellar hook assembly protein FlgD [Roseomonas marmotae]|uniref:Basal-body rod modification protein FlgD n=1 Tax=Roseomonas marmotae TaxID=2768161 RepID=A0ABS3KFB1_9PROT|nr:flagellar hook capping FlgD N-terminal domain-containing protein [Roseomonas marmotae]MBO1076125.1 flagellar hook assembly protein FlgD [Roseomonas marmotae]QTI81259.1 flagellar hook assembly protein FlgD [Roseomonas marmotae]